MTRRDQTGSPSQMKSYVVLLAVWMAAFGTAGVYSAYADGPVIIALANPSSDFDSPAFEPDHHDRHRSGTPSPAAAKILAEKGIDAAAIPGAEHTP